VIASLDGRVALVTGAAGEHGFGRAIARRLQRATEPDGGLARLRGHGG
jgi:NAD(P)-dependent dehydrogenase (short-subunit alcohol dehydrogenase family)